MAWSPALNSWGSSLATEPPPGSLEPENGTGIDLLSGAPSFVPSGDGKSIVQSTARPVTNFTTGPFAVGSGASASQGAPSQSAAGIAPQMPGGGPGLLVMAALGIATVAGVIALIK